VFTRDEWQSFKGKKSTAFAISKEDDKNVWVVLFGVDEDRLPVTPIRVPLCQLSERRARREEILRSIAETNREIGHYAHFAPMIESSMTSLSDQVDLLKAKDDALDDGPLFAAQGFVPAENENDVRVALEPFTVAMRVEDPAEGDAVPVKLRNNWFFRGFESIIESFSGIHYGEKDFTWTVGILFIIFGSLCLLDAGYGLLLAITGGVLYGTGKKDMGLVFGLTGIVSTAVGLVSGQIFGLIVGQHIYKDLLPPLTLASTPLDSFIFSLVVGVIVMAFSYSVAIWQRGVKTDATGSLTLVLAAGVLIFANMGSGSVLRVFYGWQEAPAWQLEQIQVYGTYLGYALIALAALFWMMWPDPVFGKSAHAGNVVWTIYAGSTGFVQDVLSHMRLFGIALSGSILAMVVNQIGGQLPLPATIVFAIGGHIFVYLLALLSLYIHTNRLIFLEFGSKNIDGGQNYYAPLKRGLTT
jgi:V/A-type H+-transporting ATPase subunit I